MSPAALERASLDRRERPLDPGVLRPARPRSTTRARTRPTTPRRSATLFLMAEQLRLDERPGRARGDGQAHDGVLRRALRVGRADVVHHAVRRRPRPPLAGDRHHRLRRRRSTPTPSPRPCGPTGSSTPSPTASSAATSCASRCTPRSTPSDVEALTECIDFVVEPAPGLGGDDALPRARRGGRGRPRAVRRRRPHPPDGACWVTAHMVAGLDGAPPSSGRVGALSTAPDKALFADMRTLADVVLVGARTVREEGYGPIRLSAGEGPTGSPTDCRRILRSRSCPVHWTSTGSRARSRTPRRTSARSSSRARPHRPTELCPGRSEVADVLVAGEESVEPGELFAQLAARGLRRVLCEGGPSWLGELVVAGQVDELCLTISPMMGGDPLPVAVFPPGSDAHRLLAAARAAGGRQPVPALRGTDRDGLRPLRLADGVARRPDGRRARRRSPGSGPAAWSASMPSRPSIRSATACGCPRPTTPTAWRCGRRTSRCTSSPPTTSTWPSASARCTGEDVDKFDGIATPGGP